jgi:hypothetical protein
VRDALREGIADMAGARNQVQGALDTCCAERGVKGLALPRGHGAVGVAMHEEKR